MATQWMVNLQHFSRFAEAKPPHNHAIHHLGTMNGNDHTQASDGTNVVRVPFGVRRARRRRPERPDHWATLVIPFQAGGDPTPPPQAA